MRINKADKVFQRYLPPKIVIVFFFTMQPIIKLISDLLFIISVKVVYMWAIFQTSGIWSSPPL